jgi:PAS domain S-box-containing protein
MGLHTASRLDPLAISAEARAFMAGQLNIGPRLMLGLAVIVFSMFAADAVVLWQFHLVRAQAKRLHGIDQNLIAVLRLHASLTTFHDQMEGLAESQDIGRLETDGEHLRTAVLEDSRRALSAFSLTPSDFQRDPPILPILQAVQSALPAQLDAITTLAKAGDWQAVRQRLANQVTAMQSVTLALVDRVDHEVGEEQAQTVRKIETVERLVFLMVPLTAVFTLLIAATFGLAITRSITQPLARLVEGSKALARGDFQHTVPVAGRDELAELGRVFNDTARRLQDLYATLRRSEAYLAEAQRLTHTGSWAWNLRTGELYWSQEVHRIYGLDPQIKPSWPWFFNQVHPEDRARVEQQARMESAEKDWAVSEIEFRAVLSDGTVKHVQAISYRVTDDSGETAEVIGTIMDVTERKRAEAERERLRQLEAGIAHTNRVSMMGELAASLAHEIKQPITAAVTDARTSLRWLQRDPPEIAEAREAVARVVSGVNRASEIINHLRSLYEKGAPTERKLVDVNAVACEILALLRSEANRHSISIHTDLAADLSKTKADRVQLQQVFMNLMLNAVDAMKDMGGELTLKTQLVDDSQLLISVSDTGLGLPTEKVEQIFSAFFTTKVHGTGMGLSISRTIVESHGGRLWAIGNSGRGATFHFTLQTAA